MVLVVLVTEPPFWPAEGKAVKTGSAMAGVMEGDPSTRFLDSLRMTGVGVIISLAGMPKRFSSAFGMTLLERE